MSPSLNLSQLDEGNRIAASRNQHKAKWHDSCKLKYNKTQLRRAERKKRPIEDVDMVDIPDSTPSQKFIRRKSNQVGPSSINRSCFFCGKPASSNEAMRWAATFGLDKKGQKMCRELQEHQLLAKLSLGDLIAQEAQYHIQCLANLYNRVRELSSKAKSFDDLDVHSVAFAELICYIDDSCIDTQVALVFKLSDLVKLYSSRLIQLGCEMVGSVHSTKLKDKSLS